MSASGATAWSRPNSLGFGCEGVPNRGFHSQRVNLRGFHLLPFPRASLGCEKDSEMRIDFLFNRQSSAMRKVRSRASSSDEKAAEYSGELGK